jgi:hypothetical protein
MAIFILGPDPQGVCCECSQRMNACDSCSSCTGIYFNTTGHTYGPFNTSLGRLPFEPSDCYIAQPSNDSNAIGSNTLSIIIDSGNIGPRSNAFSLKLRSGDIFSLISRDSISGNRHPAQFTTTGGTRYNLYSPQYSGYSTYFSVEGSTNESWGKVLGSTNYTLNYFPANSLFSGSVTSGIILVTQNTQAYPLISPPPTVGEAYSAQAYSTGVTGYPSLSVLNRTDYNPPVCRYYVNSPYAADIGGGTIVAGDLTTTPTGSLFRYVNETVITQDCPEQESLYRCVGTHKWTRISGNNFDFDSANGGPIGQNIQCYTNLITTARSTLIALADANRGMCTDIRTVTSDPANQSFLNYGDVGGTGYKVLNGIECDDAHIGQEQILLAFYRLKMHISSAWPYSIPDSQTHEKTLRIEAQKDACVNVLVGEGGTVTGSSFNYIDQKITGYYYQNYSGLLSGENSNISISPMFYWTGILDIANRIACPYSLP